MFRSQLIRLLITLSPKELKQFKKYLLSPIFNTHQDTIRLFEILENAYPDFETLESEDIFEKLFPGQSYKDEALRTLRKYLLSQLKDFLAYQNWQNKKNATNLSLIEDLVGRKTEDDFIKEFKKSKSALRREPIQDSELFLNQFQLEKHWTDYEITFIKRKNYPDLAPMANALDNFFIAEKLQLLASDLSNQRIFKSEPTNLGLKNAVLSYVLSDIESFPTIIQAYALACQFSINTETAEESFLQFKEVLFQQTRSFSDADLSNLYIYGINFLNQYYLNGKKHYLPLMFEFYNSMLELDLLFEGKTFSLNNYKNLVTLGLRLGKLAWVEDFIETYKIYLNDENWEGVYNYNLAHLHIYQGKYTDALRLLQKVPFVDSFYQLSTKMLQLKIYYELEEVDMFFTLAKTFETHIKRQKGISANRKSPFLNFIKTSKAIFRIKIKEKNNFDKVQQLITDSIPLIEKEWIQSKFDEIKG